MKQYNLDLATGVSKFDEMIERYAQCSTDGLSDAERLAIDVDEYAEDRVNDIDFRLIPEDEIWCEDTSIIFVSNIQEAKERALYVFKRELEYIMSDAGRGSSSDGRKHDT